VKAPSKDAFLPPSSHHSLHLPINLTIFFLCGSNYYSSSKDRERRNKNLYR
jgi:hypothetical protein